MHPIEVVVDIPSTIAVIAALAASLVALFFAWKFSKTVGGDMGAAFKWVMVGVAIFAVTRVDDVLKVSGTYAKMGIDYKRVDLPPVVSRVLVRLAGFSGNRVPAIKVNGRKIQGSRGSLLAWKASPTDPPLPSTKASGAWSAARSTRSLRAAGPSGRGRRRARHQSFRICHRRRRTAVVCRPPSRRSSPACPST